MKNTLLKRRSGERILSMLLVVCLLAGALPAFHTDAAAQGGPRALSYDFMKTNDGKSLASSFTDFSQAEEKQSDLWKYLSDTSVGLFQYVTDAYGFFMSGAGTRSLVIYVPEGGAYKGELVVGLWNEGVAVDVSLTPSDEAGNPQGAVINMGRVDTHKSSNEWGVPVELKSRKMEAGYYILSFTTPAGKCVIDAFNLAPVNIWDLSYDFMRTNDGASEFSSFTDFTQSTSKGSDPWKYLSDTSAGLSKYLTDAYGFFFSGAGTRSMVISVPVSGTYQGQLVVGLWNEGVTANVALTPSDEEGNSRGDPLELGAVNTYGSGQWGVEMPLLSAYLESGFYILSIDIPAGKCIVNGFNLKPAKAELALSLEAPDPLYAGESAKLPITIALSDGREADLSALALTVGAAHPQIADAAILREGGKAYVSVLALTEGETMLTVEATGDGLEASAQIPIAVWAADRQWEGYEYNYMVASPHLRNPDGTPPNTNQNLYVATEYSHIRDWAEQSGVQTDDWRYGGYPKGTVFRFVSDDYGIALRTADLETSVGKYGYLKINVPKAGDYTVTSIHRYASDQGIVNFYLAPIAESDFIQDQYRLATINTYRAQTANREDTRLGTVSLEAGEYVVAYQIASAAEGGREIPVFGFSGLRLTAREGAPVLKIQTQGQAALTAQESLEVPLDVSLFGATLTGFTGLTLTSTYSEEGIVSAEPVISENRAALKLTGLAQGSATVRVSASLGRAQTQFTIDVQVAPRKLTVFTQTPQDMEIGDRQTLALSARMPDGSHAEPELVSYSVKKISAAGIVGAEVVQTEGEHGLLLTALAEGSATVTVAAQCGEVSGELEIPVKVLEEQEPDTGKRDLVYDFMKTNDGESNASDFSSFEQSVQAGSDPWKYLTNSSTGTFRYYSTGYGFFMSGKGSRKMVIHVPVAGSYQSAAAVGMWNEGGNVKISLTPSDQDGRESGDTIELGGINTYRDTRGEWGVLQTMGPCTIEAGYYVLDFAVDSGKVIVDNFTLLRDQAKIGAEVPGPIAQGQTITLPLCIGMLTDENAASNDPFDRAYLTGYDSDILSCEAGEDQRSIRITGLRAGSTTITVIAWKSGDKCVAVLPVHVYDPDRTSEESYVYSLGKLPAGMAVSAVDSFNMTTAGAAGEINGAVSSAPWKYEGSADNAAFVAAGPGGAGAALAKTAGTTLRIRVPENGAYQVISQNWFQGDGGRLSVYLTRADGTGPYAERTLLKSFDTYASPDESDKARRTLLTSAQLTAGEYLVTYRLEPSEGPITPKAYIGALILQGAGGESALAVNADKSRNLRVGETLSVPVQVRLSDGVSLVGDELRIAATCSPEGIAEAMVIQENGGPAVQLTGLAEGECTLTVTAYWQNLSAELEIQVAVLPESGVELRPISYDFMKTNDGTSPISSFTDFRKSVSAGSDPWKYLSSTTTSYFQYLSTGYGFFISGGGTRNLVISVPASGNYRAELAVGLWNEGVPVDVTLTPSDENGRAIGDAIPLGRVDTYKDTKGEWDVAMPLSSRYLDAGYYILSFDIGGGKCIVDRFDLTPTPWLLSVQAGAPVVVANGAERAVALKLDVDGAEAPVPGSAAAQTLDENIATVSIRAGTQGAELILTGRAPGETLVTVSAGEGSNSAQLVLRVQVLEKEQLGEVTLERERITLRPGNTHTMQVSAALADGTPVHLEEAEVSYLSLDPTVAMVDAQGVITPWKEGVCGVRALVSFAGDQRSATMLVKVVDDSGLKSAEVIAPAALSIGSQAVLTASATMESGGAAPIERAAIHYEVTDCEPAGAAILEGNILTAKAEGTVSVCAHVTLNGYTLTSSTKTIALYRNPPVSEVTVDFRLRQNGGPGDASFASHGWQISRSNTAQALFADARALRYLANCGIAARIPDSNSPRDADIAFAVALEDAGEYALEISGGGFPDGATAAVLVDGLFIGEYSFYSQEERLVGDSLGLNSLYLEQGRHIVTLRRVNTGGGDTLYPGRLTFRRLSAQPVLESFSVRADKEVASVGESVYLDVRAAMTDGSLFQFADLYAGVTADALEISLSDPSILRLDTGYVLEAVKPGKCTVSLIAKVRGVEKHASVDVQIDQESLARVEATLSRSPLLVGERAELAVEAFTGNSRTLDPRALKVEISSCAPELLRVENGSLYAAKVGQAKLSVRVTLNGVSVQQELAVEIRAAPPAALRIRAESSIMKPTDPGIQLWLESTDIGGNPLNLTGIEADWHSLHPAIAQVSENGYVTPVALGDATITAKATVGGVALSASIEITVSDGKTGRTFFSDEEVAAARENIQKYDWARNAKNAAVKQAERFLGKEEFLWNSVTSQELPRNIRISYRYDPQAATCAYCHEDIQVQYGIYGWIVDPLNNPWKIRCPACRRVFPSNDFGSFYELGLDEHGDFRYELAHERNRQLVSEGERGYLQNILYPEMEEHIADRQVSNPGVHGFAVDDGWGYGTGEFMDTTHALGYPIRVERGYSFIAYYNHWGLWYENGTMENSGLIMLVADAVKNAYLYTGESKYGRLGAVLLDRAADVYPEMSLAPYYQKFWNSDSTTPRGKVIGCITEAGRQRTMVRAYDAFYPAFEDPYVVNFLSNKAAKYNLDNPKDTPKKIRQNIEDHLIREAFEATKIGWIHGNFGAHQGMVALGAIVLDTMPDTKEMLDWVFESGVDEFRNDWEAPTAKQEAGNVMATLIDSINRDGFCDEISPTYSTLWMNNLSYILDALDNYPRYQADYETNLYKNPKYSKMYVSMLPLTLCRRATAQLGDGGETGGTSFAWTSSGQLIKAFQNTGNPVIAQMIYHLNGRSTDGLRGDIFTKNPEQIQDEIRAVIDQCGEYDFDKSDQIAGFGFSILRGGSEYPGKDTQRDFWLYYGKGSGHCHGDGLQLGIHAYGLDMAPDLGSAPSNDGTDEYKYWVQGTVSHNTVLVDASKQNGIQINAEPLHFDDGGRVKVMDVDAGGQAYLHTPIYRRTIVMVEASDEVSYGVDFFRVKGGNDHIYSFHSQSDEIAQYQGFTLTPQGGGSYAGSSVPWKSSGYANGFSYLKNVRRDANPASKEIMVDFKVKDFRKVIRDSEGLHLRMTMLNDFTADEVAVCEGVPPRKPGNPDMLEYVLVRRKGSNLDSLFTTVFEPYRGERYLEDMEPVSVEKRSGIEEDDDQVRAVKVTHKDGRKDYIIYATNNTVLYRVDNLFEFRGAIGVLTLDAQGQTVYTYLNDGDVLGETSGISAWAGTVEDFTRSLESDNQVTVRFDTQVDTEQLAGRYLYVDNDGTQNGVYAIQGAKSVDGRRVILDIGDQSLIRSCKDATDLSKGYTYNIEAGQRMRIPLPTVCDTAPVFQPVDEKRAIAGSRLQWTVHAESPVGKTLTYQAVELPRGAQFNQESGAFTWTPDRSQIGEHHVEIAASDGALSTSLHVVINVYQGSANSMSPPSERPVVPDDPKDPDDTGHKEELFTDLEGYDWAVEAINSLADAGIIKGTGPNTFSPGKNITRADFAILLTRAFALAGQQGEPFVDVPQDAYYAEELAVAKAAGIVNGVGGNRFNPSGEITRQDMMVMLVRAMDAAGRKLPEAAVSELSQFNDAHQVADYAKAAAAQLVQAEIIQGERGKLNPRAHATRAETAVMLARVFVKPADEA